MKKILRTDRRISAFDCPYLPNALWNADDGSAEEADHHKREEYLDIMRSADRQRVQKKILKAGNSVARPIREEDLGPSMQD